MTNTKKLKSVKVAAAPFTQVSSLRQFCFVKREKEKSRAAQLF
jgi:hypothetical protein